MGLVNNSEIFEAFAPDMKIWHDFAKQAIGNAYGNYVGNPYEMDLTEEGAELAAKAAVYALVPHIVRRLQVAQLEDFDFPSPMLDSEYLYNLARAVLVDKFDVTTHEPAEDTAEAIVDAVLPYIMASKPKIDYPGLTPNDILVPKYYQMDPDTDDVIPTGEHLTVSMRVLIEDSSRRIDLDVSNRMMEAGEVEQARTWNRWGKVVSYPEITDGDEVCFIIEYDDRTKTQIRINKYHAWLVKKDTMPPMAEIDLNFEEPTVLFKNDQGLIEQMSLAEFSDLFKAVESEITISPKDAGQPIVIFANDKGEVGQMPLAEFEAKFKKEPSIFEPASDGAYLTYYDGKGGTETWSWEEFVKIYTAEVRKGYKAGFNRILGTGMGFSTLPGPESTRHASDEDVSDWVRSTEARWNRVKGTTTNLRPGSQQT